MRASWCSRSTRIPKFRAKPCASAAFGRSNTFFGVTAIVADGDEGYDYISIMPGVNVPVYLTGGTFRDTLLYNGSGSAVLDGGVDDDTLQGGEGSNVYKFHNGPGRDSVTALPGSSNEFVFTDSSESLNVTVQNSGLLVEPSNVNLRTIGAARVNGQAVTLVPFGDAAATVIIPGHNLQIDDTIVISDCQNAAWNGQFVVRASEANTISISRPAGAFARQRHHNVRRRSLSRRQQYRVYLHPRRQLDTGNTDCHLQFHQCN
jgi:hypothetical protein